MPLGLEIKCSPLLRVSFVMNHTDGTSRLHFRDYFVPEMESIAGVCRVVRKSIHISYNRFRVGSVKIRSWKQQVDVAAALRIGFLWRWYEASVSVPIVRCELTTRCDVDGKFVDAKCLQDAGGAIAGNTRGG